MKTTMIFATIMLLTAPTAVANHNAPPPNFDSCENGEVGPPCVHLEFTNPFTIHLREAAFEDEPIGYVGIAQVHFENAPQYISIPTFYPIGQDPDPHVCNVWWSVPFVDDCIDFGTSVPVREVVNGDPIVPLYHRWAGYVGVDVNGDGVDDFSRNLGNVLIIPNLPHVD